MDFRGAVSSLPTDLTDYQNGDVVIDSGTGKEYVLSGGVWEELGNSDAALEAVEALSRTVNSNKTNIDKNTNAINALEAKHIEKEFTVDSEGWYRIASTNSHPINNFSTILQLHAGSKQSGRYNVSIVAISGSYNEKPDITPLVFTQNNWRPIDKIRVVRGGSHYLLEIHANLAVTIKISTVINIGLSYYNPYKIDENVENYSVCVVQDITNDIGRLQATVESQGDSIDALEKYAKSNHIGKTYEVETAGWYRIAKTKDSVKSYNNLVQLYADSTSNSDETVALFATSGSFTSSVYGNIPEITAINSSRFNVRPVNKIRIQYPESYLGNCAYLEIYAAKPVKITVSTLINMGWSFYDEIEAVDENLDTDYNSVVQSLNDIHEHIKKTYEVSGVGWYRIAELSGGTYNNLVQLYAKAKEGGYTNVSLFATSGSRTPSRYGNIPEITTIISSHYHARPVNQIRIQYANDPEISQHSYLEIYVTKPAEIKISTIVNMGWSFYDEIEAVDENLDTDYNSVVQSLNINNKYEHPIYTARTNGLYKFSVDTTGHVNDATKVTKNDITALGIAATEDLSSAVTELKELITGSVQYLGTVASVDELKTTAGKGDFYRVSNEGFELPSGLLTSETETAHVGDILIAKTNNPAKNAYGWDIIHTEVDSNTWVKNTSSADGYVTKGSGQSKKVWATDSAGAPAWRSIEELTGHKFEIVDELPSEIDENTIYFVKEG